MCPSGNPWQPLYFSRSTVGAVDGGVGQWLDWTMCSRQCGGGSQIRMRYCNDPVLWELAGSALSTSWRSRCVTCMHVLTEVTLMAGNLEDRARMPEVCLTARTAFSV